MLGRLLPPKNFFQNDEKDEETERQTSVHPEESSRIIHRKRFDRTHDMPAGNVLQCTLTFIFTVALLWLQLRRDCDMTAIRPRRATSV